MNEEATRLLTEGARATGVDAGPHLSAFADLLLLLQEGNARHNLTALKTEEDIVLKHFVDSLTCLRGGHLQGSLRVLDLGTGGGFPTFPLAIVQPELQITPVDATRKKIEYVRATAQALNLPQITPRSGRAEELGRDPELRGTFDRVVVRAVAALPILAELALPFLKVGGLLVAQKGPITPEEVNAGRRAAREVGGEVREVDPFTLPVTGDDRTLIVIEKVAATPEKYPRAVGIPNSKPLFWRAK